uniref:Uncharacterized protein n=1 Tax=Rubinisphaera brasiliensis (strain ATCC 49424 / DSM 5305 / JCM 21570 / IAM 15109 / NBRC 103401 / IFAM 1448) TaxID=756272 RepID=F0SS35_RUBBR|nr:hypothetical protein Plabr_3784 [Rubinisphaera brasiliensis DSM 5305]
MSQTLNSTVVSPTRAGPFDVATCQAKLFGLDRVQSTNGSCSVANDHATAGKTLKLNVNFNIVLSLAVEILR